MIKRPLKSGGHIDAPYCTEFSTNFRDAHPTGRSEAFFSTIRNRARKAAPTRVTSGLVYPSDESQCRAPRRDPHDALHLARGYRLRLVGARRRRTPVPELRTDDARL